MKSAKSYVILLFALTTIGGAWLVWHQSEELAALRATAMNTQERAEWQKRVWNLEKSNRELSDQLAASRAEHGDMEGALSAARKQDRVARGGGAGPDRGARGGGGPPANALRELFNRPEVQAMIQTQRKLAVEQQYAALFRNLNLAPEQAEKLKALLADRQVTMQDVMSVAREQGISPQSDPEGYRKLMANTQTDIANSIKAVIGDSGFAQLQNYEQTMPQRGLVDQLQQHLSASGSPLTPGQADQLVQVLAANSPSTPGSQTTARPGMAGGGVGFAIDGFGGGGVELGALAGVFLGGNGGNLNLDGQRAAVSITPEAVSQAQGFLSTPQLSALQQVQQQQQAAQQFKQLVTETLMTGRANNNSRPPPRPGRGD